MVEVVEFGDFVIGETFRCDALDVRLDLAAFAEEAAVFAPGLHGEGEGGEVGGSFVDLHAEEVVFQNQAGDFVGGVAGFVVDAVEEVEGVGEHVAGAAGGVADGEVFGRIDLEDLSGVFPNRVDVVFPGVVELGFWVVLGPEAAYGVLDQIPHDPVGSEELGGGGNLVGSGLLGFLEAGHDLVFAFGDIELVEPADNLDVALIALAHAVGHAHHFDGLAQHGILGKQVGGHQDLIGGTGVVEHERKALVPVIAVGAQQQTIGVSLRVVAGLAAVKQCLNSRQHL